jgi:hypothetical protein
MERKEKRKRAKEHVVLEQENQWPHPEKEQITEKKRPRERTSPATPRRRNS